MRRKRRWFLPDTPDLIGQLGVQAGITLEGVEAFASWAAGDESAGEGLPGIEHRGDVAKRELLEQLREAFVTPLAPEDLFALSRGIDWILDYTRDLVSESEAMSSPPDAPARRDGRTAPRCRRGRSPPRSAISASRTTPPTQQRTAPFTPSASSSTPTTAGMAELLAVDQRDERISSRELYRRCARIGEEVVDVAERIIYSIVKDT